MSDAISISEAKTQLSRLIARAERGEEVVIRRGRRPVAKIVAIEAPDRPRRPVVGVLHGRIEISERFDELGPEWAPYT